MLTEEEAKTKWCPHAVASHTDPFGGFRRDDAADDYKTHPCIASKCMSWRWEARFGTDPDNPENCAVLPSTHGYCGLAGRP